MKTTHSDQIVSTIALVLDEKILRSLTDQLLPSANNLIHGENYFEFLQELLHFDIETVGGFRKLVANHLHEALREDAHQAKIATSADPSENQHSKRQGVFFSHIGLLRECMLREFGERYDKFRSTRYIIEGLDEE